VCCGVCLLLALGALERVQHLVPDVYSGSCFVLASKCRRIFNVANDAAIGKSEFRREIELDGHVPPNNCSAEKFLLCTESRFLD